MQSYKNMDSYKGYQKDNGIENVKNQLIFNITKCKDRKDEIVR